MHLFVLTFVSCLLYIPDVPFFFVYKSLDFITVSYLLSLRLSRFLDTIIRMLHNIVPFRCDTI